MKRIGQVANGAHADLEAADLATFIRRGMAPYPDGSLTEIDHTGAARSMPYAELLRRASLIAGRLREVASKGRTVVLCCESVHDFVAGMWACIFEGVSVLPVQVHRASSTSDDIATKLRRATHLLDRPVLMSTSSLRNRLLTRRRLAFSSRIDIDEAILDKGRTRPRRRGRSRPGKTGETCLLFWTSGTTAEPRIAKISFETQLHRAQALSRRSEANRTIQIFPFDSISSSPIFYPRRADTYYMQPDRLARRPLDLIALAERYGLTHLGIATSMGARLLRASAGRRRFDLSALSSIGFGAEPIVPELVADLCARFHQFGAERLKVSFGYGMTETGLICATVPESPRKALPRHANAGASPSVGKPRAGWFVRIVDDTGKAVRPGKTGGIEVWSSNRLFSGYLGDDEESPFTRDGWFRTGDVGAMKRGKLRISGRDKATIIVNGRNVSLGLIEQALRGVKGINPALLAAVPIRPDGATTDELAVFFVPDSRRAASLDGVVAQIMRATMKASGVATRHAIPLAVEDFPLSPSGKMTQSRLAALFEAGSVSEHVLGRPRLTPPSSSDPGRLAKIWQDALGMDAPPKPDDNFHDLGGDSLASAELIFAVEEFYGREIPIDRFFQKPTLATMARLVGVAPAASPQQETALNGHRLLHRLQSYVATWQGQRLFPNSLIVGSNTKGGRLPIFWVLQEQHEQSDLPAALGRDQPFYALRSCVRIMPIRHYSTDVLETVANRYLWEILALSTGGPIILGGNCQGAIIALALARKLRQIGRPPRRLILMEWSYSFGRYEDPTTLLYGRNSHTAGIYSTPQMRGPDWRSDFPRAEVEAISGGHGQFFTQDNIGSLAATLLRLTELSAPSSAIAGLLRRKRTDRN